MRYEQGLCNGVSKGINTSFDRSPPSSPVTNEDSVFRSRDWLSANQGPDIPPPSPINLKELVNVMDNLKCEYQVGLDRIYGDFQDRVSEYPQCL